MIDLESLDKLPKHRKDWLEIYGNTWAPKKVRTGTCELCVWGYGVHAESCITAAGDTASATAR